MNTTLPNDVARCPGITEVNARLPINLCATCARWQSLGTGGPRTPHIPPAAGLRDTGDRVAIYCDMRIGA